MSNIKFWCAVGTVKQLMFNDNGTTKEIEVERVVGEQHIVYQEVLMCRQSRETLKNTLGAKKQKTVAQRIEGVKVCQRCQDKFKQNQDLGWFHWINPPELKNQATVHFKPELLQGVNDEQKQLGTATAQPKQEDTG